MGQLSLLIDSNLGDLSMTKMKLGETKWKSEPTDVEESADELWLREKCHSNSELVGCPSLKCVETLLS